ncbi:tetratricopeptide repeat protein [Pseudokordiimonas caeni]|uniref:tetratricopeptide repeat protein n=1 Tax=Pseudokordiimonas caeni TaxID=2997908 RepID=UPI00281111A9|nr:tetratricopeptide repeat protein [Pseudokordiimonas caeni]
MKNYKRTAILFGGTALLSLAALPGPVVDPAEEIRSAGLRQLDELTDPNRIAGTLCGKAGQQRGVFFRPDLQHALSSSVAAAEPKLDVPLYPGLDQRKFPISTKNAEAQTYFNQGHALLYGFNHGEAIRAFRKAQELDPNCAICYWGEAVAWGPNINMPMPPEAVAPAFAAISKALALKANASEKEAALIDAAAKRYSPDPNADRAALDAAYSAAMETVHKAYPDDDDIAAHYAESVMDLSPWYYWERDFITPRPGIEKAVATIESVLARNPDHYGAIHLYIHLVEATPLVRNAEPFADKLAALVPGSGHLVHMPAHIYFRIGRYIDSLDLNVQATAVDEAYLQTNKDASPMYRYGYYPHNVHFVLVSAQMAADGKTALEYGRKLDAILPPETLAVSPMIAPVKAAHYFAWAHFGSLDEVMALPDPGEAVGPFVRAHWHYARGMALARAGDARAADEAAAIEAARADASIPALEAGGMPAGAVLDIASRMVRGVAAAKAGDYKAALATLEEARKVQASIPYMEPPFWYQAVDQTVGAVHLMAGDAEKAAEAFRASLVQHPNSAWSLYGLMKAQEAMGNTAEAAKTKALLAKASRSTEDISLDTL